MNIDYADIVLKAFAPLLGKFILYRLAFYLRKIKIAILPCVTIAGASVLLSVIPIPLPQPIALLVIIAISTMLTLKYTEAELYPDGLLIPVAVEIIFAFGITPLLELL